MAQQAWPIGDAQWASEVVDETYITTDRNGVEQLVSTTNKDEPPVEVKEGGNLHDTDFWRQWHNWTLDHYARIINTAKSNIDDLVGRTISTSGSYLQGGGDLSADRDITLDYNALLTQLKFDLAPAVGTVMTTSGSNPDTVYTGTTWIKIAAGSVIIGQDAGDTDFDTVGETGGSKTHAHTVPYAGYGREENGGDLSDPTTSGTVIVGSGAGDNDIYSNLNQADTAPNTGSSSNVPPYVVKVLWERTA